jgi:branched-chain amino acid aminotransferase
MVLRGPGESFTLVTPELSSGTLLPGVTRDSILRLAADLGYGVEERPIALDELQKVGSDGTLVEAFACGTAAIVTPIGTIRSALGNLVECKQAGPIAMRLREELTGIQCGTRPDRFGWMHRVA